MLRLLLLASTLLPLPLIAAEGASAGTYTVWSCRDGANLPAPTDGWAPVTEFLPTQAGPATNGCAAGQTMASFFTGFGGTTFTAPMRAGWQFTAPADVVVEGATLDTAWGASGTQTGDNNAYVMAGISRNGLLNQAGDPGLVAGCSTQACNRNLPVSDTFTSGAKSIGVGVGCYPSSAGVAACGGGDQGRAHTYLYRARLTLAESLAPTASGLRGGAVGGQPLAGTQALEFTAADRGSGVWHAEVRLGGVVVRPRGLLEGNNGSCNDPAQANGFLATVPCRTSLPVSVPIDTTKVSDGVHALTVVLWDAAGNAATAVNQAVTVRNAAAADPSAPGTAPGAPAGGPNGTGGDLATARFKSKKRKNPAVRTATYDRKVTLSDRLVDAKGKAIAGARIDVIETVGAAAASKVGEARTDAKGRFKYLPGTTSARLVEFAYARTTGSTSYVDRRSTKVRVNAAVSLGVSRPRAGRMQAVRFSGTVKAGKLPKGGVQVVLETKGPRGWLIGGIVTSTSAGKFSWNHRFRNAASYRFRARVLRSAGLDVSPGVSRNVTVRVR